MARIRSFRESDIEEIDRLWKLYWSHHSMPDRENRIIDAVATDGQGTLIGYGQVKLFGEAMLFLDPTVKKRDRVDALRLLMVEAFRGCEASGINELYAFIQDPQFSELIQRRYSFKLIQNPGDLLLRKV